MLMSNFTKEGCIWAGTQAHEDAENKKISSTPILKGQCI